MENELENVNSQNDTEETVNNEEPELDVSDDDSEELANLRKENATLKAQKEHFKKKAETKAEEKSEAKEEAKAPSQEISTFDAMALIKADVTEEEDVNKVKKWADLNGLSLREALKDSVIVKYLADKKEERQTALATNTGTNRKSSPISNEAILEKAQRGELKEDDIDKLVNARMEAKINKKL